MKKLLLYIAILFLFNIILFSQEENKESLEILKEEPKLTDTLEKKNIEDEVKKEDKKEETVFRDPIFGIDYTTKDLGAMTDFDIINERDTLRYTRELGKWWIGAYANPGFNYYIGNYEFSKFSYLPNSEGNPKQEYKTKPTFTILNFGALFEWNPVRQVWGLGARFQYERLLVNSFYEPTDVALRNRVFNTEVYFDYVGISPYGKYKTPIENLNLFGGFDVLFPWSYKATFRDLESGTSKIIDEKVITDEVIDIGVRYGLHVGIEYEIMVMDIQKSFIKDNVRMKIAPFTVVSWSSSPISNSGGSYPLTWKIGLSVKLGPDKITSDTIRYNPTPRYDYLAKFDRQVKIKFDGFLVREKFNAVDLALVEVEQVGSQIKEEPDLIPSSARDSKNESQIASDLVNNEEEKKQEFKKGFKKTFTFRSSPDTKLTREMRQFLDDIAAWMKDNPKAEIRVVGHSDQAGSGKEIQERSFDRAKEVQKYIVGKTGIDMRRVLITGVGARDPVGDIYSEAGKAKNRRVEIEVVGG